MDIRFRLAEIEDLPEVCAMVDRVKQSFREDGSEQWDEHYPTTAILEGDIRRGEMSLGLEEGKLAAVYTLNDSFAPEYKGGRWAEPEEPYCVLHRLCVDPSLQGRGVGRAAMDEVEAQAARMGARYVRLDYLSINEKAKRLYEKRGYAPVGAISLWGKGEFILMEKKL